MTVYPFILRGVRLLGVDQTLPWDVEGYPNDPARWAEWLEEKKLMWKLLGESLEPDKLARITAGTIGLADLVEFAPKMIKGEVSGRLLVDVAR